MTSDLSKFENFEENDDGGTVNFGSDVPYLVKGKGSLMLNDKIRYDDAYWVQGLVMPRPKILGTRMKMQARIFLLNKCKCTCQQHTRITKITMEDLTNFQPPKDLQMPLPTKNANKKA